MLIWAPAIVLCAPTEVRMASRMISTFLASTLLLSTAKQESCSWHKNQYFTLHDSKRKKTQSARKKNVWADRFLLFYIKRSPQLFEWWTKGQLTSVKWLAFFRKLRYLPELLCPSPNTVLFCSNRQCPVCTIAWNGFIWHDRGRYGWCKGAWLYSVQSTQNSLHVELGFKTENIISLKNITWQPGRIKYTLL